MNCLPTYRRFFFIPLACVVLLGCQSRSNDGLTPASGSVRFNGNPIEPNQGTSLVPTIKGGSQDPNRVYYFSHGRSHAVIKGNYKVIRGGRRKWQLHNTANDKTEMTDLAEKMPEKLKQLTALWDAKFSKKKK
jgi:arylsulfatase A-like enzyme